MNAAVRPGGAVPEDGGCTPQRRGTLCGSGPAQEEGGPLIGKGVVVLNGSPRTKDITAGLVGAFCTGARDAGNEVKVFALVRMDVHECRGCFGGVLRPPHGTPALGKPWPRARRRRVRRGGTSPATPHSRRHVRSVRRSTRKPRCRATPSGRAASRPKPERYGPVGTKCGRPSPPRLLEESPMARPCPLEVVNT